MKMMNGHENNSKTKMLENLYDNTMFLYGEFDQGNHTTQCPHVKNH